MCMRVTHVPYDADCGRVVPCLKRMTVSGYTPYYHAKPNRDGLLIPRHRSSKHRRMFLERVDHFWYKSMLAGGVIHSYSTGKDTNRFVFSDVTYRAFALSVVAYQHRLRSRFHDGFIPSAVASLALYIPDFDQTKRRVDRREVLESRVHLTLDDLLWWFPSLEGKVR